MSCVQIVLGLLLAIHIGPGMAISAPDSSQHFSQEVHADKETQIGEPESPDEEGSHCEEDAHGYVNGGQNESAPAPNVVNRFPDPTSV